MRVLVGTAGTRRQGLQTVYYKGSSSTQRSCQISVELLIPFCALLRSPFSNLALWRSPVLVYLTGPPIDGSPGIYWVIDIHINMKSALCIMEYSIHSLVHGFRSEMDAITKAISLYQVLLSPMHILIYKFKANSSEDLHVTQRALS